MRAFVKAIDPAGYENHLLHRRERAWAETNCYVDLWVELLHGLGYEPIAALAFTLGLDFEGDQLTFFKFPLEDLYVLYGVEVIELNVWRSLVGHVREQVGLGRVPIVEVDAFYLPDTAGISYGIEHVKTSIAIQDIDPDGRSLGYFHGQSYYRLEGVDFGAIFRLEEGFSGPHVLPPYVEVAKFGAGGAARGEALVAGARALTKKHLARRPRVNPYARYRDRFASDLTWLREAGLAAFHGYAFATLRQAGSCSEFAAAYLRWLSDEGEAGLTGPAEAFEQISSTSKTMMLKVARAVNGKKPFDAEPFLTNMVDAWSRAIEGLDAVYG